MNMCQQHALAKWPSPQEDNLNCFMHAIDARTIVLSRSEHCWFCVVAGISINPKVDWMGAMVAANRPGLALLASLTAVLDTRWRHLKG